jgi:hypothetical protein
LKEIPDFGNPNSDAVTQIQEEALVLNALVAVYSSILFTKD